MSRHAYATALRTPLAQLKNICPGVKSSFISTKDGAIVASNSEESAPMKRGIIISRHQRKGRCYWRHTRAHLVHSQMNVRWRMEKDKT